MAMDITITKAGIYHVSVLDSNNCSSADTIAVFEHDDALPNELFLPQAFSPNNDNINDTYPGFSYSDPGSPYLMRIFNRWGEKIFESNSPSIQWDGTVKNEMAEQDVYVYYVKYVGCDEVERWFRGTFTLLR